MTDVQEARPTTNSYRQPTSPGGRRSNRRRFMPVTRLGRVMVWVWSAFNVALLVWIVTQSFRDGSEIFTKPFKLPRHVGLGNYRSALDVGQLGSSFLNTVLIAGSAAAVVVAISAPAAYVLSRSANRSASPITTLFALGMGIPVQAIVIPMFVIMSDISSFMNAHIGWWDDRLSLGIVYIATSLPFAVFLLTGFFRSLPSDLEEAAAIDGCSGFRTFRTIMFPLARPGIITAFTLTLMGLWNETLLALIFITDTSKYTLPQALLGLYGTMQYTSNWGGLFAGVVIIVVPIVIVYVVFGRHIVNGMTVGAGK